MYVAANPSSRFPHDGRFTRQDRAFNACCAALALGASLEEIADLVVDWMDGKAKLVRKHIDALRLAQDRRLHASLYQPAAGSPEAQNHEAAWEALLARIPPTWVETGVLKQFFNLAPDAYEKTMQTLEAEATFAYDAIMSGDVKALKANSDTVKTALEMQARLIVLHTALDRLDLIRMFAKNPLGDLGVRQARFLISAASFRNA